MLAGSAKPASRTVRVPRGSDKVTVNGVAGCEGHVRKPSCGRIPSTRLTCSAVSSMRTTSTRPSAFSPELHDC
jgi:hypothetical protein